MTVTIRSAPTPRPGPAVAGISRAVALASNALPFVAFFGLWQGLSYLDKGTFSTVFASPSSTVQGLIAHWGDVDGSLRATALESVIGYACGNAIGFVLAFLSNLNRTTARFGMLMAVIAQSVPVIAFSAVFMIWFGNGILPRVIIATYICFFPMLLNVDRGLRSIGRSEKALFDAFGASRLRVLRSLSAPSVLPPVFTALKASAVLAVGGAIVGELFGAQRGLGVLMVNALYNNTMVLLWEAIYLAAALSLVLFVAASVLQRRFAWW